LVCGGDEKPLETGAPDRLHGVPLAPDTLTALLSFFHGALTFD